jgi:hypothetical protein
MIDYQGNQNNTNDFLEILLALKRNINKNLNVADVAQVINIDDEIYCKLLSTNETIKCIKLEHLNLKKGDVVLILYCNTEFKTNLIRIQNGSIPKENTSNVYHSKSYGIIIGVIYKEENNDN